MPITLDDLRRFAVTRSLFTPTTLKRALHRLGFVQADPIRAPARAQDLTLRHRVKNYRAGDLARRYSELDIEEDFFVTYGFVTRSIHALMHPRSDSGVPAEGHRPWPAARRKQAQLLLEFVRDRGAVHPREVDDHFSHGTVRNYWGGSSNATTHLLDAMHYRGLLRVARREGGVRIYTAHQQGLGPTGAAARGARIDVLVDVASEPASLFPARDAVANGLPPFSEGRLLLFIGHVDIRPLDQRRGEPGVDSKDQRFVAHAGRDASSASGDPRSDSRRGPAPPRPDRGNPARGPDDRRGRTPDPETSGTPPLISRTPRPSSRHPSKPGCARRR